MIIGNKNIINNNESKIEELKREITELKVEQRELYDKIFNNSLWLNFEADNFISLLPTLVGTEVLNYICYSLGLVSKPIERVMLFSTLIVSILPNIIVELKNKYYLGMINNNERSIERKNCEIDEIKERNRIFSDFIEYALIYGKNIQKQENLDNDSVDKLKIGIK